MLFANDFGHRALDWFLAVAKPQSHSVCDGTAKTKSQVPTKLNQTAIYKLPCLTKDFAKGCYGL